MTATKGGTRKGAPTGVGYARISQDDLALGRGVERQGQDITKTARAEGLALCETIIDNDVSASRYSRKVRPGWARMLELCRTGAVDAVVVYDLDRLTRRPRELEDLIDLADKGLRVVTVQGDVDLSTSDGRFIARILVGKAAKESDDVSRRVKRAALQKREQGLPKWSFRPYGFELDGTHRADEAATLRKIYARFLDGESLRSIAQWCQAEGVTQPARTDKRTGETIAKPFTVGALSALLKADRNAGLYRSRIEGETETTTPAAWLPIVDADIFARTVRILEANTEGRTNRVRHLLSGLLHCAECGGRMTAMPRANGARQYSNYRCRKDPAVGQHGCGRAVSASNAEAIVTEAVLDCLADPANRKALRASDDEGTDAASLLDVIALATERKRALLAQTDDPSLGVTLEDIGPELRKIAARVTAAQAELARARAASPIEGLPTDPAELRAGWDALAVEERRAIIVEVLEPIVVRPTSKAGRNFDRTRIGIAYRAGVAA